jgi:hypothetical protein
LDPQKEVLVLDSVTPLPNSILVGTLKVGDTGFTTDCGYNKIINDAKIQARKFGGNIVQIIELKRPKKGGSTCYRIKANILSIKDKETFTKLQMASKKKNETRLPSNADYAKVFLYRPKMFTGNFIGYKVRMDTDSIVCRVRNGEKCEIKIYEFGRHTFWAKTETKDSLVIDIQKGQEYFIRCGMNPGILVGRPDLNQIENHIAIKEFEVMHK